MANGLWEFDLRRSALTASSPADARCRSRGVAPQAPPLFRSKPSVTRPGAAATPARVTDTDTAQRCVPAPAVVDRRGCQVVGKGSRGRQREKARLVVNLTQ
ncbi:hypothetical protein D4764_13G0006100, partial [Takifugu flavidus]